jgi:MoaA/NifB/PqqE/SkfB family radical SAM enzyme
LEALKKLSYLKSTNPLVNFEVITIILNGNLEELLDIAHFIHSLGTNSLQFQPLLPNNLKMAERKTSPFWITPDRLSLLDDKIDKLIYFKKKNPEFIKNSERNLLLVKKYYRGIINYKDVECNSAEKTILISNEGKFTTCFSAYGDIKKQSLEALIQSKERERATEKLKNCRWPCLLPCFCDTSNM